MTSGGNRNPANVDRGGWAGRRRFECFTVQACLTTASINATDPVSVTVSIGVAELGPDDDLDGLLHRADEALYQAKAAGRNRVNAA